MKVLYFCFFYKLSEAIRLRFPDDKRLKEAESVISASINSFFIYYARFTPIYLVLLFVSKTINGSFQL